MTNGEFIQQKKAMLQAAIAQAHQELARYDRGTPEAALWAEKLCLWELTLIWIELGEGPPNSILRD